MLVQPCWGARSVASPRVQSCSWRPWTLSRSSYWQLCLGPAKDVPPSSLTALQMVSQECIEEYNSWVKAFLKKSITLINALLLLFWKCCFTSSEAAARGFPTEWGFPALCQVPVPRLLTLPAVSQCQPGAVHKDCMYCSAIWLMAFPEGATSVYRNQPRKFWYLNKYT